jgi:large subunit ribosomal protein L5
MFLDNNNKEIKSFQELYLTTIKNDLLEEFGYTNRYQVPSLTKIVINMGVGDAALDSKVISRACNDLAMISGQKPIITKSRKSIARFKVREGMDIGCKVTLRRKKMFHFLERLAFIALPRIKEFRGFSSKSFDGRGNFSFGISEQIVFSEIDYDKIDKLRGMNITIVTTAKTDLEAKSLLQKLYLPFYNN